MSEPGIGHRTMLLNARRNISGTGPARCMLPAMEVITQTSNPEGMNKPGNGVTHGG